jgi:glutathione peroxidase
MSVILAAVVLIAASPGYAERGSMQGYDFEFTSIEGDKLPLSQYRGHPVLVVNTASFCGYTPQYQDLEALWRTYRDRGLVVIGVPSNDFGAQEPGSETEIGAFCDSNYGVSFPMTAKQKVVGDDAHPFYRWAVEKLGADAAPRWNFHKILIGENGELLGYFGSKTTPDAPEIAAAVDK